MGIVRAKAIRYLKNNVACIDSTEMVPETYGDHTHDDYFNTGLSLKIKQLSPISTVTYEIATHMNDSHILNTMYLEVFYFKVNQVWYPYAVKIIGRTYMDTVFDYFHINTYWDVLYKSTSLNNTDINSIHSELINKTEYFDPYWNMIEDVRKGVYGYYPLTNLIYAEHLLTDILSSHNLIVNSIKRQKPFIQYLTPLISEYTYSSIVNILRTVLTEIEMRNYQLGYSNEESIPIELILLELKNANYTDFYSDHLSSLAHKFSRIFASDVDVVYTYRVTPYMIYQESRIVQCYKSQYTPNLYNRLYPKSMYHIDTLTNDFNILASGLFNFIGRKIPEFKTRGEITDTIFLLNVKVMLNSNHDILICFYYNDYKECYYSNKGVILLSSKSLCVQ